MKKLVFTVIIAALSLGLFAQEDQRFTTEGGIFKINIIPLNFSYELATGNQQTITPQVGFHANVMGHDENFYYSVNPVLSVFYRNYYNMEKRVKKGKRTAKNSANYFGGMAIYNFSALTTSMNEKGDASNFFYIGPMWGIQRNYKSHISLGLYFTMGLAQKRFGTVIEGGFEFTFGFWL